ncbi:MAG TPA: hypothetical protein VK762_18175 [Polyangiaceae bacterium]|nr:hypothetical protein [Polyangiaceae bacterium]
MPTPAPPAGLCESCLHCKEIRSGKGSVFRLCLLHERDPRFAKYPRIPVLQCPGYAKKPAGPTTT